jgi:LysM repeat protein
MNRRQLSPLTQNQGTRRRLMTQWTARILIALLLLAFTAVVAAADTRYTVHKGDTLSKISRKFHVSVDALRDANDLGSDRLKPGVKLVIPGKGTQAKTKEKHKKNNNEATSAARTAPSGSLPGDETGYHVVRKGETVAGIARTYGLSVKEMNEMNYLSAKRLKKGQRLIVRRDLPDTCTVRDGDTVAMLAKKFNVLPDDIVDLNELDDEDTLKAGRVLKLREMPEDESVEKKAPPATVSAKIAEVRELSKSEELASLPTKERLMLFAKKMLNLPYRFGGNGIIGVDCSSFVQKVYSFVGHDLPRSAREQFRVGEKIDREELVAGDLLFFKTYASFPSHVGIYLGNNLFIHASSRSKRVQIERIDAPYYVKRYIGAKRLLAPESEPVVALENITINSLGAAKVVE